MTIFQNLTVPVLIRYGLTGFVAVTIFAVLPALAESPARVGKLLTAGSATSLAMFGLATGFLLDALKIYQLVPGYRANRESFLEKLKDTLKLSSRDEAIAYFSKVAQLEKEKGGAGVFFIHSRWIMVNILSSLCCLAGLLWGLVGSWKAFRHPETTEDAFLLSGLVLLLLGLRLTQVANQQQVRVGNAYILFLRENRVLVKAPAAVAIEGSPDPEQRSEGVDGNRAAEPST